MNKRGISNQQFHWIFVLIAGAIILLFFFTVINSVKTNSDRRLAASMVQSFDAVFTGAFVTDNTLSIIPSPPNTAIDFICDADGFSEFFIDNSAGSTQNAHKLIFAPGNIQGREIVVFTRSIDLPYKIDNALYISDVGIKYVIIDSSVSGREQFGEQLYHMIPDNITADLVDSVDFISAEGYRKVVVVVFDQLSNDDVAVLENLPVNIVEVQPFGLDVFGSGSLQFFETRGSGNDRVIVSDGVPRRYFGAELLLGAMFAENGVYYDCGLSKFLRKLEVVSLLYEERLTLMQANVDSCQTIYADAQFTVRTMLNLLAGGSQVAIMNNFDSFYTELSNRNEEVELRSCPFIY